MATKPDESVFEFKWSPDALALWEDVESRLADLIREKAKSTAIEKIKKDKSNVITEEDMLEFIGSILQEIKEEIENDSLPES